MSRTEINIFAGRNSMYLGKQIADNLHLPLGKCRIVNFSDGEIWVKYNDNIRGKDVYIVQSTNPPGDNIIELLIMIDAAMRASANRITAVIPYFGYARQDRKDMPRVSVTAKLMANLITEAGADRVIAMDLHAPQIQGFFDIPVDHMYCSVLFIKYFKSLRLKNNKHWQSQVKTSRKKTTVIFVVFQTKNISFLKISLSILVSVPPIKPNKRHKACR